MGREIVFQESLCDIGRRSRLWSIEDIDHVLGDKRGSLFIHGIVLESSPETYEAYSDPEAFSNMPNLKLLMVSKVHLLSGLTYFPNSLKVLSWDGYPLETLPFDMQVELVDLKMHHSQIIQPWNEIQFFKKLKSIDLSHSNDLTETPIVSGAPHLEQLILEGCTNLVEVHQSVGQHKKLVELNMKNCINLKIFPSKLEMDSLKDFILSGCSKVEKLPEFGENMKCLMMLVLKDCTNLLHLPSTIGNLKSLEILNISGCSKFSRLPNNMNEDQPSDELDVSGIAVRDIILFDPVPMNMMFTTISHLPLLKELDLSYSNLSDGSIPYDLSGFSSLWRLSLNGNNFYYLPDNFVANLSKLRFLELNHCSRLQRLPILPPDLRELRAKGCASLEPVFHPLQLWNFLALDDKMESSSLPRSTFTGSEIPPWFEYQNYVSLDREFVHMDLDSIISIGVHIPHHCLTSEWWRIDLCIVLQYVTSDPLENTSANVYWTVLATEPGFPSHRGFVCIPTDEFHTPHLYVTSLRGLQEQLRGDSDQLEIRIGCKTSENGKMKIRKCGCHVYCKDDVEVWHRAKASIDYSTTLGISFPNLLTSLDSASDDAMDSRDNEMENVSDDAMDSRDTSLQPQLYIDDEKENTSDDHILDYEREIIDDDSINSRDTSLQPQLHMSKDHILDNEKNTNVDAIEPGDTTLQRQFQTSKDHVLDDEKENKSDDTMKPRDSFHQLQMSNNDHILDYEREIIGYDSINSRDTSKDHVLENEKKNTSDDAIKPKDTTLQLQLQVSKGRILDNEKENILSSLSMRPIRRFSTSRNSRKQNALKISNLIHPNTDDQNLQKLPITSDEIKT
ncbi:hypothetical protein L6164_031470 [Bauhinia variegata]|uniref:Uncharacterized protein n=1 Tax=Bauhinia variegata TaxID=167791 RepID=A0ACB9LFJ3_BAUVA|nr:hypothetical protein L6164_031470 [Bauhinia variegata]